MIPIRSELVYRRIRVKIWWLVPLSLSSLIPLQLSEQTIDHIDREQSLQSDNRSKGYSVSMHQGNVK